MSKHIFFKKNLFVVVLSRLREHSIFINLQKLWFSEHSETSSKIKKTKKKPLKTRKLN